MRCATFAVQTVAVALGVASLAGCGVYEWPNREVKVAPRHFVVHEEALMQIKPEKDACAPVLTVRASASCDQRCGPIVISQGGAKVLELFGPELRRASTVDPDRVERPYATPPVDQSRSKAVLSSVPASTEPYLVDSKCKLSAKAKGGDAPKQMTPNQLAVVSDAPCGYEAEVSCS